jgi:hypothetical protein
VPFHTSLSVRDVITQVPSATCPGMVMGTLTSDRASGPNTATHLGKVTASSVHCGVIDPTTRRIVVTGHQLVFTAVNGDTITAAFSGLTAPTGPSTYSFTGSYTVTGGTGRFAGATGGGDLAGSLAGSPATGLLEGEMTAVGRLSY